MQHIEQHFSGGDTVRDVVIGMADGLTVPFALAAGISGALTSSHIVVTAGLAEIAAGCIAMGMGGYLAARSDCEHYESEKRREEQEIREKSEVEKQEIVDIFADVPSTELEESKLEGDAFTITDALVFSGLAPSKGEAKRLVQGGGVAVNNVRTNDVHQAITAADFIDGQVLVLRKGTRHYHLIKVVA